MLRCVKLSKILVMLSGLFCLAPSYAAADYWQMNMYKGVSPLSKEMYHLHMIAIVVCALIGLVVFGVMIYSLIHHRKSKAYPAANFHDNPRLEIFWTIIPFIILVALAVPATRVLIKLDNNTDSAVTIKITGFQWKWQYQYLNEGISYFSTLSTPYDQIQNLKPKGQWYLLEVDKPLVVPVHQKIRFLVTSNDVIHSWWVPELGVKRDAIPGFIHEAWTIIEKPGIYRGQCAELCGINHGFMPIVVQAVEEEQYKQWLASQVKKEDIYAETAAKPVAQKTLTREELMSLGQNKYNSLCSACHKADGTGLPKLYPPLKGSSVAVGKPISRHINLILNGVSGTAMQAFKNQLSDEEIAALVTYERNAWGNNTNDMVQPADVAAVRKGDIQAPTMVNKVNAGGLK